MGDTRAAQRSSMSDACCVDRLIVGAVFSIQIEPASKGEPRHCWIALRSFVKKVVKTSC